MYETISKHLEELFEEAISKDFEFQRKTYESSFEEFYKKYEFIIAELLQVFDNAETAEEIAVKIAEIIPQKAKKNLDRIESKRKKERMQLDYNMAVVTLIMPFFFFAKEESADMVGEALVGAWNHQFEGIMIKKATFETIQGGFRKKFCYVTTAVYTSLKKSDDCYELECFRTYRDSYLMKTIENAELVEEYYDIAPTIVKRINKKDNADEIYLSIWETYLKKCLKMIENQENEQCKELYREMVHELKSEFVYT